MGDGERGSADQPSSGSCGGRVRRRHCGVAVVRRTDQDDVCAAQRSAITTPSALI